MDSSANADDLPWPLNLPEEERLQLVRVLTPAGRLALADMLSMQATRRWMAALRQQHPYVTKQEFRDIVIRKRLEEGEEEARIARGEYRKRNSNRDADGA